MKCSRISSGLLIGLEMGAVMYQQQKNDSEAYMVWKERESSWTWFRRKGFGTVCECFTSALCAGPHLLYAEQQVLVLLRLRGRGGVAALHLHRTTCSSAL